MGTGGADDRDKAQTTAAEVMAETVREGESAFLMASAAGELSGRVPSLVLTGAGDGGGPGSSQARFMQERAGGTGIEAAVA